MIEIGNLTLPENLNLGLPEDDLIRRGDAVNAIRKACIMEHIPFSTKTPEGRRTIEAMAAVRNVPAADVTLATHGNWVYSEKYADLVTNKCSICGQTMTTMCGKLMNYCPNCGAKMDKEG